MWDTDEVVALCKNCSKNVTKAFCRPDDNIRKLMEHEEYEKQCEIHRRAESEAITNTVNRTKLNIFTPQATHYEIPSRPQQQPRQQPKPRPPHLSPEPPQQSLQQAEPHSKQLQQHPEPHQQVVSPASQPQQPCSPQLHSQLPQQLQQQPEPESQQSPAYPPQPQEPCSPQQPELQQQQAEPHPQQHRAAENEPIAYGERGSSRKGGDLFYVEKKEKEFYCLTKYDQQSNYVCRSCQNIRRQRKKKQPKLDIHKYKIDENNGIHGQNDPRDPNNHYCEPLKKVQKLIDVVKKDFFTDSNRPVGAGVNELMAKINEAVSNESLCSKVKNEIKKDKNLEKNIMTNERKHWAKKHGQKFEIVTRQKAKRKRSFVENEEENDEDDDDILNVSSQLNPHFLKCQEFLCNIF